MEDTKTQDDFLIYLCQFIDSNNYDLKSEIIKAKESFQLLHLKKNE